MGVNGCHQPPHAMQALCNRLQIHNVHACQCFQMELKASVASVFALVADSTHSAEISVLFSSASNGKNVTLIPCFPQKGTE